MHASVTVHYVAETSLRCLKSSQRSTAMASCTVDGGDYNSLQYGAWTAREWELVVSVNVNRTDDDIDNLVTCCCCVQNVHFVYTPVCTQHSIAKPWTSPPRASNGTRCNAPGRQHGCRTPPPRIFSLATSTQSPKNINSIPHSIPDIICQFVFD